MLLVPFERDFQKIAKNLFPARKTSLYQSQKLAPAKQKKSPIRKNLVPQGNFRLGIM